MATYLGRRVRILSGMSEFVGMTGTIIGKEDKMYRVRLDETVTIQGVGKVTDDLWEPSYLKTIRHKPSVRFGF